ncbi:MAG: TPMT family class I SAM-dependent methyltransferase [Flavobacteriales bacterium]|nr:TPMT family class I SAM-dependent methyltransferase [Flavobacteriales bacterium]
MDQKYWDQRWMCGDTGWDIGYPAPAILDYAAGLPDKTIRILIPGCGNAYEAQALLDMGFKDVHLLDISPTLTDRLKERFQPWSGHIHIHCEDFFEHQGSYHLILEQTFLCALNPSQREAYAQKCQQLLYAGGRVAGLLFDTIFEQEGPPFGGTAMEYRALFGKYFRILKLEKCLLSIPPRQGREVFFEVEKIGP